jgi:hypothetical protein
LLDGRDRINTPGVEVNIDKHVSFTVIEVFRGELSRQGDVYVTAR